MTSTPDSPPAEAQRLSKPVEIEELIDLYFHRPVAHRVVRLLAQTPVTPNQVTIFAGLLGVAAGIFLWFGAERPVYYLYAALLLFSSVIFDCCDGQLARLKNITSTTGAILDGIVDYFVGVAIFTGAAHAAASSSGQGGMWWLGAVAGASTVAQCGIYDQIKIRYVRSAGLGYQEREEDLDRVALDRLRARQRGDYRTLFLLWVYEKYSKAQQAALREPVAEDPGAFRQKNRRRMRAWTTIGPGTHLLFLYSAAALSYVWPSALSYCFWLFATAMNVVLVALLSTERRSR
jgi:phosphatidylglycerophosphate synthase